MTATTKLTTKQKSFFKTPRSMTEIITLFNGDEWEANHFQTNMLNAGELWLTENHCFYHLKGGSKIEILCNIMGKDKWMPGVFNHTVTALDRDFRVNCTLDNGVTINEAAPECVRPKSINN